MKRTREEYKGARVCEYPQKKSGAPCANLAYYLVRSDGRYSCGVHCDRKDTANVATLKADPNAAKKRTLAMRNNRMAADRVARENAAHGKRGRVRQYRMRMMTNPPLAAGWLNVFPNRRHGNRKDGVGLPRLSPMTLGPVHHRQPGLPPAKNIENYHQFNKVWPMELGLAWRMNEGTGKDTWPDPDAVFFVRQKAGYEDVEPHRHKFSTKEQREQALMTTGAENRNAPCYSVHQTLDGAWRRFSYVESRYFYCKAFEALATHGNLSWMRLKGMLDDGYQLVLCGYDAYNIEDDSGHDLYWHYCNPGHPFGHEMVLHALLVTEDPSDYPWNQYRHAHPGVYEGIAHVVPEDEKHLQETREYAREVLGIEL